MRRIVLTILAVAGVGAALVVTASSTTSQARAAGMDGDVVPYALVVLLEVVNVAGTWTWLTDTRTRVRIEAAVGVGLASLVTGWLGVAKYDALGVVAPVGLLAAVHLLSRLWSAPLPTRANGRAAHRAGGGQPAGGPVRAAAEAVRTDVVDVEPPAAIDESDATRALPAPPTESPAGGKASDDDIVAALVARDELPGRDAVKAEFGCGSPRADRLIARAAELRDQAEPVPA